MKKGKRSTAEGIVYGAMEHIQAKTKEDPLKVFEKAIDNVRPMVETKSRRVGGATYQVPIEVEIEPIALGRRPLADQVRRGAGRQDAWSTSSSAEIIDALANKGGAVKKREDTHKMAEANRAFAHYRW